MVTPAPTSFAAGILPIRRFTSAPSILPVSAVIPRCGGIRRGLGRRLDRETFNRKSAIL
jgi:hypothetical protein